MLPPCFTIQAGACVWKLVALKFLNLVLNSAQLPAAKLLPQVCCSGLRAGAGAGLEECFQQAAGRSWDAGAKMGCDFGINDRNAGGEGCPPHSLHHSAVLQEELPGLPQMKSSTCGQSWRWFKHRLTRPRWQEDIVYKSHQGITLVMEYSFDYSGRKYTAHTVAFLDPTNLTEKLL